MPAAPRLAHQNRRDVRIKPEFVEPRSMGRRHDATGNVPRSWQGGERTRYFGIDALARTVYRDRCVRRCPVNAPQEDFPMVVYSSHGRPVSRGMMRNQESSSQTSHTRGLD